MRVHTIPERTGSINIWNDARDIIVSLGALRVMRFLLGLFLIGCSTGTSLYYFAPHSTSRMKEIFKNWSLRISPLDIPPAVCFLVCFVLGLGS